VFQNRSSNSQGCSQDKHGERDGLLVGGRWVAPLGLSEVVFDGDSELDLVTLLVAVASDQGVAVELSAGVVSVNGGHDVGSISVFIGIEVEDLEDVCGDVSISTGSCPCDGSLLILCVNVFRLKVSELVWYGTEQDGVRDFRLWTFTIDVSGSHLESS